MSDDRITKHYRIITMLSVTKALKCRRPVVSATEDNDEKQVSIIDHTHKTLSELKQLCKEQHIKCYSGKKKNDLIIMLKGQQQEEKEEEKHMQDEEKEEAYTADLLKKQYTLHKEYVMGRINTTKKIGVKVRLPSIPEDISENIVKQIIHNKCNDRTSGWDCQMGDLHSKKEGKQECKCFTSDGPPSFTPSSDWDVIYFLDARRWLMDQFILYRVSLKRTSTEWKNIKVSKAQTFEDQTKQGRRPRITWESLYPQISSFCNKVYEGTFDDIFIPLEAKE